MLKVNQSNQLKRRVKSSRRTWILNGTRPSNGQLIQLSLESKSLSGMKISCQMSSWESLQSALLNSSLESQKFWFLNPAKERKTMKSEVTSLLSSLLPSKKKKKKTTIPITFKNVITKAHTNKTSPQINSFLG